MTCTRNRSKSRVSAAAPVALAAESKFESYADLLRMRDPRRWPDERTEQDEQHHRSRGDDGDPQRTRVA